MTIKKMNLGIVNCKGPKETKILREKEIANRQIKEFTKWNQSVKEVLKTKYPQG